jgi:hypothetical protein
MRFVPVKTADQQAAVLLHRGRERPSTHETVRFYHAARQRGGVADSFEEALQMLSTINSISPTLTNSTASATESYSSQCR